MRMKFHKQSVHLFPNLTALTLKIKEATIFNQNWLCCSLWLLPFILPMLVHVYCTPRPLRCFPPRQPQPAVGWGYSISDALLQLCVKWKELEDMRQLSRVIKWSRGWKDNNEKYSFQWVPTSRVSFVLGFFACFMFALFYSSYLAANFFVTRVQVQDGKGIRLSIMWCNTTVK